MKNTFLRLRTVTVCILVSSLVLLSWRAQFVKAADLTALSDTMSRMKESVASDHTILFTTPSGVDAPTDTITVAFPTGFNLTSVLISNVDLEDDGVDKTLAASPSAGVWGWAISSQTMTFTAPTDAASGEIAAGSIVGIKIGTVADGGSNQIVNCTVAQNNTDPVIDIAGTFGDSGGIAVEILSEDQIAVTATVDPYITFTLTTTTLAFGTLSTSAVGSAGPNTMNLQTNATNGYTITVRDAGSGASPGLYNSTDNYLIASADAALSAGTEGYGGQCAKVLGDGSCQAPYNVSGDNVGGFLLTSTTFASYNTKPSSLESFTVTVKAAISNATEPGSYADTLTFIATGNF